MIYTLLLLFLLTFIVVDTNAQITVSTGHPATTFVVGGPSVVVAPSLTVSASGTIQDVKISIETIVVGDVLDATVPSGFTKDWNNISKILTVSGSGTASNYESMLRTVTFSTSSTSTPRKINFIMANVVSLVITSKEHVYELVNNGSNILWTAAKAAAEAKTIVTSSGGTETGYLATITSQTENDFIKAKVSSNTWLGASDAATEGEWFWVTGPETGQQFWSGGAASAGGSVVGGMFNAWYSIEPNNAGNEDYMHMYGIGSQAGTWNDFVNNNSTVKSYLVEYGGKTTSPDTIVTSDFADVTIDTNIPPVADNDSYSRFYTDGTTPFTVLQANGVINGDTDDGKIIPLTAHLISNVTHGVLSLNSDGSFIYTSNSTYIGSDSFTYHAYDGIAYSNTATVTLSIVTPRFTGAGANDNFSNPANWNTGYVPPESLNIVIAANQHINFDVSYTCKTLKFETGSSFDCTSPNVLTIAGNVLKADDSVAIEVSSSIEVRSSIEIAN